MRFTVLLKPSARKNLTRLPGHVKRRVITTLGKLADNPFPTGVKKLRSEADTYRVRLGDYRIIYEVHGHELTILVLEIGHRRDVYR